MKRLISIFCLLVPVFLFAQQTSNMKAVLQHIQSLKEWKETYYDSAYLILNEQIESSDGADRALWHSLTAELLNECYRSMRYQIWQRAPLVDEMPEDFKMWDEQLFKQQIHNHAEAALNDRELLKKTPLASYDSVIIQYAPIDEQATLYDYLITHWLHYYHQAVQSASIVPEISFRQILLPNAEFVKFDYSTIVKNEELRYLLALSQEHTAYCMKDKPDCLISATLLRYNIINSIGADIYEAEYMAALSKFEEQERGKKEYYKIAMEMGSHYLSQYGKFEKNPEKASDCRAAALKWYEQALAAVTDSMQRECISSVIADMKQKRVSLSIESCHFADQPSLGMLSYLNVDTATLVIINTKTKGFKFEESGEDVGNWITECLALKQVVSFKLPLSNKYGIIRHDENFILPALPAGDYLVIATVEPIDSILKNKKLTESASSQYISITNLQVAHRDENGKLDFFVTHRKTGVPISGAKIELAFSDMGKLFKKMTLSTDENGRASYVLGELDSVRFSYTIAVSHRKERLLVRNSWGREEHFHSRVIGARTELAAKIYTDKGIYRPGDTIYFKSILYDMSSEHYVLQKDHSVDVILQDPNGVVVEKKTLVSNNFGSMSSYFVIPHNTPTGGYAIRIKNTNSGWTSVLVEEYKKPKFSVMIDGTEDCYRINDPLMITGKVEAFSGYALDDIQMDYRIDQSFTIAPPYSEKENYYHPSYSAEMKKGILSTAPDGSFSIQLHPYDSLFPGYIKDIRYSIVVSATDKTGETHETSQYISISRQSLFFRDEIPERVELNGKIECKIRTVNQNETPQQAIIHYTIHRLETPLHFYHENRTYPNAFIARDSALFEKYFPYYDLFGYNKMANWKEVEMVAGGEIDSGVLVLPSQHWKEGCYRIKCYCIDNYGDTIKHEAVFWGIKKEEKSCRIYDPLWIYSSQKEIKEDGILEFVVGSYCENATVLVEVWNQGKVVVSEIVKLNQSKELFKIPLKGMMPGDVDVRTYLSINNEIIQKEDSYSYDNNFDKLKIELLSLREKYAPGEQVTLKMKTTDANDRTVQAELLCGMYDASLDKLRSNTYFAVRANKQYYFYNSWKYSGPGIRLNPTYNFYSFSPEYCISSGMGAGGSGRAIEGFSLKRSSSENVFADMDYESGDNFSFNSSNSFNQEGISFQNFDFRTNFKESAFFHPHLVSDSAGVATFSFQMPESLTAWHFQCVAHTQNLKMGTLSQYIRTEKPLMVISNTPRFFREGDTIDFNAKVVNRTEKDCRAAIALQLTDSEKNSVVALLPGVQNSDTLALKANGSTAHGFRFVVPGNTTGITYRIIATMLDPVEEEGVSITHSDGEQNTIPVLPNRMLVTESLPLQIAGNQTKTFALKKMKEQRSLTLEHFNYTVELTANPVWEVLLSLPYLMESPYDGNEQIFSRIYAHSMAADMLTKHPEVKEVFAIWEKEDSGALQSPLLGNPELKNMLLQETPWVAQAQSESQQRKNIARLFDLAYLERENRNAVEKLLGNQNSDGSWSWFGMGRCNPFITRHILAGFGKLKQAGISTAMKESAIKKAISFVDNQEAASYKLLKKERAFTPEQNHLSPRIAHYLYMRSFYSRNHKLANEHQEMLDFYMMQAEKYWATQSVYTQALLAIAFHQERKTELAEVIMIHLKGKARYSDELGMYWSQEGAGWRWYEAPIERQALLIDAFRQITKDEETVEKARQWLLSQKQSQHWGSTKATVDACHALLATAGENVATTNNMVITVGKTVFDLEQLETEAGTGYFKTSWSSAEITPDLANVKIEKSSPGLAWGGIYWQYFEELAKITPSQNSLSVAKKLYKVIVEEGRERLLPIKETTKVLPGDRVRVRLEIRSDRDIDFVHLKDARGANFEPVNQLSGYRSQGGLWYYESPRDASTNFFIDHLPKGTYTVEYTLVATQTGTFNTGITTIQSMYAPEFSAHGKSGKLRVQEGD